MPGSASGREPTSLRFGVGQGFGFRSDRDSLCTRSSPQAASLLDQKTSSCSIDRHEPLLGEVTDLHLAAVPLPGPLFAGELLNPKDLKSDA